MLRTGFKYWIFLISCTLLLSNTSPASGLPEDDIKEIIISCYKACQTEDIKSYMSLFDFSSKDEYKYDYQGLTRDTAIAIFNQYDMKIDSVSNFTFDIDERGDFALTQFHVTGSLTGTTVEGETKTIRIDKTYVAGLRNIKGWKIIFVIPADVYYASLYDTSNIIAKEPVKEEEIKKLLSKPAPVPFPAVPSGYFIYKDAEDGFSLVIPKEWKRLQPPPTGARVCFYSPEGPNLLVSVTDIAKEPALQKMDALSFAQAVEQANNLKLLKNLKIVVAGADVARRLCCSQEEGTKTVSDASYIKAGLKIYLLVGTAGKDEYEQFKSIFDNIVQNFRLPPR